LNEEGNARGDWRRAVLSGKFRDLSDYFDDPPDSWTVDATKRPRSAAEFFRQLMQAFS